MTEKGYAIKFPASFENEINLNYTGFDEDRVKERFCEDYHDPTYGEQSIDETWARLYGLGWRIVQIEVKEIT
jgi:hypothetical protein